MTRAYVSALFALIVVLAACSQPATPDPVAPTVSNFRAEQSTITAGESTTLSWTDASADATLTLTPDVGDVTGKTSVTVSPTETTEYTLTVSNSAGSNQYKLTVTVKPKDTPAPSNRTPVSQNVVKSTQEGTAVTVQLSGSDPDGDPLRYSIVAEPQNGSLNGLNPDTGEVTYTPNANFNGADTFTFSVSDGKLSSAVATVTVNVTAVNDAPTANAQTRSTPEETPVVVTLSGSDPEGADLEYVVTREPTHGTLGALEPTTHKVTYTPAQDYNGTDSFTFVVSDGELTSAEATVIIKVGVVNDQPVAAAQSVTLDEDNAKTITLTAQDADKDALTYAIVKQPEHGKVSGLNASTGKLTYTPNKDYNGADSFTFKVNDGTEDSEVQTVSLTINPVNDAPVIAGGDSVSVTMSEDGSPDPFALTLNASDVDSSTLTWSVSSGAAHGTASVSGTGASKEVAYSPEADYNGSDKFVVKVVDGKGGEDSITVNVTAMPVDDAPTALTLSNDSVDENKPIGTVVGTFSTTDIDSTSFTYSPIDGTNDNASFTIEGNVLKTAKEFDFETKKTYTVEVQSKDEQGVTLPETFTVSINNVDEAPLLTIDAPADGAEFTTDDTITLKATAVDPETGNISSDIVWISDLQGDELDGDLGTGASINVQLVAGNHTLTASVTDAGGNSKKVTLNVKVIVKRFTAWQFGSPGQDAANSITTNSSGNIYIAGETLGSLPGNTNVGSQDAYIAKYDSSGNQIWIKQFGTSEDDSAQSVATDNTGNVYITGYTSGSLPGNSSAGSGDAFLAKYDGSGNQTFMKQFGSSGFDSAQGVAIDSSGNVYIAGYTGGTLLGGSSAGGGDAFLTKYDSSGNQTFIKQFGSSGQDSVQSVTTDSSGNVYVTGYTSGNLPGNTKVGIQDAFLAKYDGSGNQTFMKQFGSPGQDYGRSVTTDSSGNVYVTGSTAGSLPGNTKAGSYDAFLAKYDNSGNQTFIKQFGSSEQDYGQGVATDSSGNVYIAGYTSGSLPGNNSAIVDDAFLAKYDSSGNRTFIKQFGSSGSDTVDGVAIDNSSNVYIVGYTDDTLPGNTNSGNGDAFLAKYAK